MKAQKNARVIYFAVAMAGTIAGALGLPRPVALSKRGLQK